MDRIEGFCPKPRGGEYIYAKMAGPVTTEAAVQRFLAMLEACGTHGLRKVLFDYRGRALVSQSTKVVYLRAVADIHRLHVRQGGNPIRLAFLADPHNVPNDGVEGPMAHSLGLDLQWFACPMKAIRYLDLKQPGITVAPKDGYVSMIINGAPNPERAGLNFINVLHCCRRNDLYKVMIDCRGGVGATSDRQKCTYFNMVSRFYRQHLEQGGKPIKIVYLARSDQRTPDRFGVMLLEGFGLDATVVTSMYDAFVFLGIYDGPEKRLYPETKKEFFHLRVKGVLNVPHGIREFCMMLEACRNSGKTKVLLDMTCIRGYLAECDMQRLIAGAYGSYHEHLRVGGKPVEVAAVWPPDLLPRAYVLKDACAVKGLRLRFTNSHVEAMKFLNVFDVSILPDQNQKQIAALLVERGHTALFD